MPDTWKLDEKNTSAYLDLCRRAVEDESIFAQFRNMDPMTMIVENSPVKSGLDYYNYLHERNEVFRALAPETELFSADSIGNPALYKIGDRICSPSTMRYVKTLFDILKHFDIVMGMTIGEIGAGYGGLCKIIHDVCVPADYHIFDLPEPLALQKKFLSKFGITPVTDEYPEKIDLLIAMYSWSELSEELQIDYLNNVIKKAKNCYIMLNYDMDRSYQLIKDTFPHADIKDFHIFGDESMTDYAPYDRYIIIKN